MVSWLKSQKETCIPIWGMGPRACLPALTGGISAFPCSVSPGISRCQTQSSPHTRSPGWINGASAKPALPLSHESVLNVPPFVGPSLMPPSQEMSLQANQRCSLLSAQRWSRLWWILLSPYHTRLGVCPGDCCPGCCQAHRAHPTARGSPVVSGGPTLPLAVSHPQPLLLAQNLLPLQKNLPTPLTLSQLPGTKCHPTLGSEGGALCSCVRSR